jgi:hypothetical protein
LTDQKQPLRESDRTTEVEPLVRPIYEPPRLVKKRPVSRATLFSGTGPDGGGVMGG